MTSLSGHLSTRTKTEWFALTVAPRRERAVAKALMDKGIETLVPCCWEERVCKSRRLRHQVALFPGYLFAEFDPGNRLPVLVTPGVRTVIGCGNTPIPISNEEIAGLRVIVSSRQISEPWPHFRAGDRVRVERGPLAGLEGTLVAVKSSLRIVLAVDLIERAVAVEVTADMLNPPALHGKEGQRWEYRSEDGAGRGMLRAFETPTGGKESHAN